MIPKKEGLNPMIPNLNFLNVKTTDQNKETIENNSNSKMPKITNQKESNKNE